MIEQGTAEWHAMRLGKLTASRFHDAVTKLRDGSWGASRARYQAELIAERLTGEPYPQYQSEAMRRGSAFEAEARAAYQFMRDVDVEEVGFVNHPTIIMSGCSPDGLVEGDGLVEFKCPDTHTHIATLLGRAAIPIEYAAQMHWQMACTGRSWCDWCSFDPRMPAELQLYVQRVGRNDTLIEQMEHEACVFLDEVERAVSQLTTLRKAA